MFKKNVDLEIHRIVGDTIRIVIHNGNVIPIRILHKNLQSIISVIPEFFGRINNFLPGFCNNNADIYCGAAVLNYFKCNSIPCFRVDYWNGNVLGEAFGG